MRGKDTAFIDNDDDAAGSPPLARERRFLVFLFALGLGITPACAGKTFFFCKFKFLIRDHPRLRGKDFCGNGGAALQRGSPPLARERPTFNQCGRFEPRITPACAGKTFILHTAAATGQDHPRLRGKDFLTYPRITCCAGSPPLARERRRNT